MRRITRLEAKLSERQNAVAKREQLTQRQRDVYEFIRERIFSRGYGPTVREIGKGFGIRSPNGVMCHLRALEKKGLISREPNMSRAIQLLGEHPTDAGLPLAGRIAAGQPLEAVEQNDRINFSGLFDSNDHFVLEAGLRLGAQERVALHLEARLANHAVGLGHRVAAGREIALDEERVGGPQGQRL